MKNNMRLVFIIIMIFLGTVLRTVWLNTLIERDEGSFGYIGWRLHEGDSYYEVAGNKPPLIYYTYYFIISIFGNNITPIRIFNNLLFILSIPLFYLLCQRYIDQKSSKYATTIYVLSMNIPIFGGIMAMTESFVVFFSILAIYSFTRYEEEKKSYMLVLCSIFSIIAILYKQTAIILFILITYLFLIKKMFSKILLYLTPVFISIIYILTKKNLQDIFISILLSSVAYFKNIEYVSFWYVFLIIGQSLPLIFLTLSGLVHSKKLQIIFYWLCLSFIISIIPNSYGHYYLQMVPSASILAGLGMNKLLKGGQKKTFLKTIVLSALIIISIFFQTFQYPNFNTKSFLEKIEWSDSQSKKNQLEFAKYIMENTLPSDEIIIWGNEPSIAWISSRKLYNNVRFFYCKSRILGNSFDELFQNIKNEKDKIKVFVIHPQYPTLCENRDALSLIGTNYNYKKINNTKIFIRKRT